MRTQREFIIETVKQTIQAKNILKIKEIIDIAYEYIETNLSISTIKDYVPYAINVNVDGIQSAVLPGGSYGPTTTPAYPLWFFVPDKKETAKLIQELYGNGDTEEDTANTNNSDNNTTTNNVSKIEASKIKIEILDGSGSSDSLDKLKKALSSKGYKVTKTTATNDTAKTTIINKSDIDAEFIDNIKSILGTENVSSNSVSSSNVDITIILGKDYK